MFKLEPIQSHPAASEPVVDAREVRRFRVAMWVVLALGLSVLGTIAVYGNSPRSTIDKLNPLLAVIVGLAFSCLGYAMWRFRKRCGVWPGQRPLD